MHIRIRMRFALFVKVMIELFKRWPFAFGWIRCWFADQFANSCNEIGDDSVTPITFFTNSMSLVITSISVCVSCIILLCCVGATVGILEVRRSSQNTVKQLHINANSNHDFIHFQITFITAPNIFVKGQIIRPFMIYFKLNSLCKIQVSRERGMSNRNFHYA